MTKAKPNFEIIPDLSAEWGDSPMLFSVGGRDEFIELYSTPDDEWGLNNYPDADEATFEETLSWLSSLNDIGRNFVFGNAIITKEEMVALKNALDE